MTIVFSADDLRLFSQASGDRNPLHLSESYARATSYGQPVVFGCLGILAALSQVEGSDLTKVGKLTADFHRPMFAGVNYQAAAVKQDSGYLIRLLDGSVTVLTVKLDVDETIRPPLINSGHSVLVSSTDEAEQHIWQDLEAKPTVEAEYGIDLEAAQQLLRRFSIDALSADTISAILWSSYFIGMKLPGERALFFRCLITLSNTDRVSSLQNLRYTASVHTANAAMQQVRILGDLISESRRVCSADFRAFFRPPLSIVPEAESATSNTLSGRVALVIGASRGLGASIALSLAQAGAQVLAGARSEPRWIASRPSDLSRRIEPVTVDAADPAALTELRDQVITRYGRLNFLVCNAFPPIPSLRLEENAFGRLSSYIAESVDLALAPMCVFLNLLNESAGMLMVISSPVVETPVREWPHYSAAKAATEMLAQTAAQQYPNIKVRVFRPDRMLTEMTNTPAGRQGSLSPAKVAVAICREASDLNAKAGFALVSLDLNIEGALSPVEALTAN